LTIPYLLAALRDQALTLDLLGIRIHKNMNSLPGKACRKSSSCVLSLKVILL